MNNDHLKHYASPYYDPVKAHEYYMRTRELKGRQSTAGLNEEGRIAAKMVKENLNEEKKSTIQSHKNTMTYQINVLRSYLNGMEKSQKLYYRARIQKQINLLRQKNQEERERLQQEYEQKYNDEMEKIHSNPDFIKWK